MEDCFIDIVKTKTPWFVKFQVAGHEPGVAKSICRNTIDEFADNFLKVLAEPRGSSREDTKMANNACAISAAGSAFVPTSLSPDAKSVCVTERALHIFTVVHTPHSPSLGTTHVSYGHSIEC